MKLLLQEYKNIVEKIKEYLISELKKRYDDIKIDDNPCYYLLNFVINQNENNYYFDLSLENGDFFIRHHAGESAYVKDFGELFDYIDDEINEEAE